MKIQIPKDQAIKILQDRLDELNNFDLYNKFNPKVWKDRTILDLKQIFGVLGDQCDQWCSIRVWNRARKQAYTNSTDSSV